MGRTTHPFPTEREVIILRLSSQGYSYRNIAEELHLSEKTIKTTACYMFARMGADNIIHAVALAVRKGLI